MNIPLRGDEPASLLGALDDDRQDLIHEASIHIHIYIYIERERDIYICSHVIYIYIYTYIRTHIYI